MKSSIRLVAVIAATQALACVPASAADDHRWRIQLGPANIRFHESASFEIAGTPSPGAGASLQNNTSLLIETLYQFTPEWSVGLTVGSPARTRVSGAGSAAVFGEIGAAQYGAMALTARYTFNAHGRLHPYLGAGITYFIILNEYDNFIENMSIKNTFGSVLQAGIQYDINKQWGLFMDLKKLYAKTSVTGRLPALGGAPVNADVRLNPSVLQLGISYRF